MMPVSVRPNQTFPNVRLDLTDDSQYSIEEGLKSGAVDVYFASVMADFQLEGVEKCPVAASNQYGSYSVALWKNRTKAALVKITNPFHTR
ncbi:MAG: hypothetical protein PUC06_09180 [Oscillospiraceae bacterium]|nr:hypothetical protein [Oscillospiraceae bacterium]